MRNKLMAIFLFASSTVFSQNSVQINATNKHQLLTKKLIKTSNSRLRLAHPYDYYFDQKIKEYEERMEINVKKYKKMARLMKKPQYSDPSYFGHKRKPKKRGPGKRKFCKECGIVH